MSELIHQQQNSLGELFLVRKNGDLMEFSVKTSGNGEINLGFYDKKEGQYKIWRDDRHIMSINDVPYFGINKKIVFETKTLRYVEIEMRESTSLIVPKELPGKEIIVNNTGSFLDEFLVPVEYILKHEIAPF